MKRLLFSFLLFVSALAIHAVQIQLSTTLPSEGSKPEHLYRMQNGNGLISNGKTTPTAKKANYGQFAFYASSHGEGNYYIYSYTESKWLTYEPQVYYAEGKNLITLSAERNEACYFKVNCYDGTNYELQPYTTLGTTSNYINWYQGLNGNPYDGETTLGVWTQNGATDPGSSWRFREFTDDTNPVSNNDWENATIFERNKEKAHATYMPYPSTKALRDDAERYAKPWLEPNGANYLSLNGTWHLKWNEGATVTLLDSLTFWGDKVETTGWDTIPVPSCLEMHGYGQPLYMNINYAFEDDPPYIEMKEGLNNSVGSYRRDFVLPTGWETKRVFLHFDGIYSAAYVYVNGHKVGYTEGANNVSEFDVTPYVRTGTNNVSVAVIRWSDGSYLEGQDMWHMSGIHRDVYLFAVPKTYIADHYIMADVTPGAKATDLGSAATSVKLTVCNRDKTAATKQITVKLYDPAGTLLQTRQATATFATGDSLQTVTSDFGTLQGLKLWSADTPNLYTFEVSQQDNGREEEAFSTKFGFCKISLANGYLEVNGRRTYLKGANLQDTDPINGRTYGVDLMIKDITMMKQANMNAVRTSHYPRHSKMMALFDYYGMYIVDEADQECHKNWTDGGGVGGSIVNDASWDGAITDRVVRMVLRDRNNPSVMFWSLGNESGVGPNIYSAYNAVRALDDRYIHYERSQGGEGTDMYSVQYWPVSNVSWAVNNTSNKPFYLSEYAHAMGNAVGNLKEYWNTIIGSPRGIGGTIWDWVDQSIYDYDAIKENRLTSDNGFPRYITGFDCPTPQDKNFVNNGLVNADRSWSSELDEVKRIYQWVDFNVDTKSNTITLTNNYLDRNLSDFNLMWKLLADGKEVEHGTENNLNCVPGESETINISVNNEKYTGKELLLNVSLITKKPTTWCGQGYPIAEAQATVQAINHTLPQPSISETNTLTEQNTADGGRIYSNGRAMVCFDGEGNITAYSYDGQPVFTNNGGPKYDNYRWVENDNTSEAYSTWGYAVGNGVTGQSATFNMSADKKTATVSVLQSGNNVNAAYTYTVYANGTLDVSSSYTVQGTDCRRVGFSVDFPKDLQNVKYYARGPRASYIDRLDGEDFGIYEAKADSMYEPFAKPQSNGNHIGLRWLTLTNNEGKGVKVEAEGNVAFSLNPWNDIQLRNTRHNWELPASDSIVAHFDAIQKGLGNGSCGPAPLDSYTIKADDEYSNTIRFTPYGFDTNTGIETLANGDSNITITAGEKEVVISGIIPSAAKVDVYATDGTLLASAMTSAITTALRLPIASHSGMALVRVTANGQTYVRKLKL